MKLFEKFIIRKIRKSAWSFYLLDWKFSWFIFRNDSNQLEWIHFRQVISVISSTILFDRFQAEWLPLYPFLFQSAFDECNCFLSRVQLWGIWRDADSFYAFFFHKFLRSGAAVQWCIIKNKAQLCTSIIVLIESISNITNEPSKRFCCNWLISCQNPFQPDWWYPNDKAHCKWIRVDG